RQTNGDQMAVYEFRCPEHGSFEIEAAIGAAPSTPSCSVCGGQARRVFSAPMLGRVGAAVQRAVDNAERSSEEPDVVTSLPAGGQRSAQPQYTRDPKHRRLPKPWTRPRGTELPMPDVVFP